MKAKLVGKQIVDFTSHETGEAIKGIKLHLVGDAEENTRSFAGRRVATVFTQLPVEALKVGGTIELVYEQQLGSKNARLVDVRNV